MVDLVRLNVRPEKPGRFTAYLEGTGEVIVQGSRQPLVDGARALLDLGFDPATPLTMRHAGKAYDSFRPVPIGRWAGWTYEESEKQPLRQIRWTPFPAGAGTQKSGSEAPVAPEGHETEIRSYDGPPQLPNASGLVA
jgi:hypothetical protein